MILQGIADFLANPPLRTYSTSDPVFLTCISVARLTRYLEPTTQHIITISECDDPTHIAVVRSIHPVWNRVSSNMSMSTLESFDPKAAYNAPRNLFTLFYVNARKVQLSCLRCKATYTSESNCRSCLRSHRSEPPVGPTRSDLERLWDCMPSTQRLALCHARPPISSAINTRAYIAQIPLTVSLPGTEPGTEPGNIILRIVRGDLMAISTITGHDLVEMLDTVLEGGMHRVKNWSMHDFEGTYEPADFYAYIATLVSKNLIMASQFAMRAIKSKESERAETELRISEDARKAAEAKKVRLALKRKEKNKKKMAAMIAAQEEAERKQHIIYAQLKSSCRFLAGVARCLLESVDGDASKLIVYDPIPRQPGGFDPVAAENMLRRLAFENAPRALLSY